MNKTNVHANKKLSFKGTHIYIGMDVHKKTWVITVRFNGLEMTTKSLEGKADVLANFLRNQYPDAVYHAAYEAGCCGFHICRELKKRGIDCIVVNPADIPTSDKDKRQKDDVRDSRTIAKKLEINDLKAIHVPLESEEYFRSLFRSREQVKLDRRRIMCQIRSHFLLQGIDLPKEAWSKKHIALITEKASASDRGAPVCSMLRRYQFCNQEIKLLDKEIAQLIRDNNREEERTVLESAPGIGRTASEALIAEMISPYRFRNDNNLFSYFGLIPGTASSGEKETSRGITPRRRGKLRHIIIEAAWVSIKTDPELGLKFSELCGRMKKSQAIVRIARKLLLRIRRIWLQMQPYVINSNIEPAIQP